MFTLATIPKGEIKEAKLTKIDGNKEEIIFLHCDIDKYTVICSEPNEIVIKGEYQLTSIEGDDTYIVTSILSKKLKFDNLVFPFNNQNLTQTVNGDNPSFSLSLLSEVTDLPSIYVGSTITKNKKVNWVINSNNNIELLCTPNEKNMPMKGTYEIYYLGACGNLYTTNIIITYIPKIAITVLKLNNFCSSSPFTEISLTINAIPTGSIQKAILQNKKSLNLYNFQVCNINNKIVKLFKSR